MQTEPKYLNGSEYITQELPLFSQSPLQVYKYNTVYESRHKTHTSLFFPQSMLSPPEDSAL